MEIGVSANGADLDAPASPVFGRRPAYVFVDTDPAPSQLVVSQEEESASPGPPGEGHRRAGEAVSQGKIEIRF